MWVWSIFWALVILGTPLIQGGTTYIPVTGLRLIVLFMSGIFLLSLAGPEQRTIITSRFDLFVLLFWVLAGISLFVSSYQYITVYWYVNIMTYMALFYLGLNSFGRQKPGEGPPDQTGHQAGWLLIFLAVYLLIFMGAFEGAFGIIRYFLEEGDRAKGTFFNPAFYAGYLIAICPLCLAILIFPSSAPVLSFWARAKKPLLFAALILMILGMIYSGSRAVLAAILALAAVLFSRWRNLALVLLLLFIASVAVIPNPLRERVKNLDQNDLYAWERIAIWKSSLDMTCDQPYGIGLGMYKYRYFRFMRPVEKARFSRYPRHANTAHSEPLHLAAELSPLAPLLLLIMAGALIMSGFRESTRADPSARPLLAGLSGSLLGISLHSLFDSNLHNPSIAVAAVLLASMLSAVLAHSRHGWLRPADLKFSRTRALRILIAGASGLLGALFLILGTTYGLYLHYSGQGDPEREVRNLVRLSRYTPGYAPLFYRLGEIGFREYTRTGNLDLLTAGTRQIDHAFHLNPENYLYPLEIARGHLLMAARSEKNSQLLEKASHFARLSLKRNPYYPFTFSLLAEIAEARSDPEDQMNWLRKALEVEPYYLSARGDLIELLLKRKQVNSAREQLSLLKEQFQEVRDELKKNPDAFPTLYERQLVAMSEDYLEFLERTLEAVQ
jgi:hypothetical protein